MKTIRILILLSLFLGSFSVFSQATNTEVKKSDLEKNTEQTDPGIKRANQPPALVAGEKISTARESKSSDLKQVNKNDIGDPKVRTAADNPDPSMQAKQSKAAPSPQTKSKLKTQGPRANEDPKKLK